jgi:hypothetical protein
MSEDNIAIRKRHFSAQCSIPQLKDSLVQPFTAANHRAEQA